MVTSWWWQFSLILPPGGRALLLPLLRALVSGITMLIHDVSSSIPPNLMALKDGIFICKFSGPHIKSIIAFCVIVNHSTLYQKICMYLNLIISNLICI